MRLRFVVLACVLAAAAAIAAPGIVSAAPRHNHGLTINVTPKPILAGEGVLIYGQLNEAPVAGQPIVLYHHIIGSHRGYTRVSATTTDSHGFYSFPRAEGVVMTNRSWFVRQVGAHRIHSRTVFEPVAALVDLAASATTADTNQPVVFTGHVTPNHRGDLVLLQQQPAGSDTWRTVKSARLGPGSNYSIVRRFRVPGERDVRVVFRGDGRNTRGESDPVTVTIEQAQVPGFTINTSDSVIPFGSSATLSGTLDQPGTTTPEAAIAIRLCQRVTRDSHFECNTAGTTGTDGSYSFTVTPAENTIYQVRTALGSRHTAVLSEGVQDLVTMTPSSTTSTVGEMVTFTGTVTPDQSGHVIYLQRLAADGHWHNVEIRSVQPDGSFQFSWTFGNPGSKTFRARITSDRHNVGGASAPVTITVSSPPSTATLPQGS
jgi:hypothetical protein